jgi:hypothetical protein
MRPDPDMDIAARVHAVTIRLLLLVAALSGAVAGLAVRRWPDLQLLVWPPG